ncbi:MAG: prepilin-type N-terminal cleavage/methylation domain-containing protein [Desulfurivibrionaceae bacterium]|jgi:MSHA biogenesis protein MshO
MKTIKQPSICRQNGFTMMELIIVIVLLGIIGAMGAEFISQAFKGFFDTDIRMEMYEEGKAALVRMEREIHIAVPNAVKPLYNGIETDTCDETTPCNGIKFGVIDDNAMAGVFGQYTEARPTDGATITDRSAPLPATTLISIYNTTWEDFALTADNRVYSVITPATPPLDPNTMTLDRNIVSASPYGRYYAVRPEAVSFSVGGGSLLRSTTAVTAGNALSTIFTNQQTLAQNVQPAIDPSKIAPNNKLPYFTYEPGTSTRNSVVSIHFAISSPNGEETVNFHKEVQIRNVP